MGTMSTLLNSLLIATAIFVGEPGKIAKKYGPVTIQQIKHQVPQSFGIVGFVKWLEQCENVSGVDYNHNAFLISDPPQQWVYFSLDGERYRLFLRVLQRTRLELIKTERLK